MAMILNKVIPFGRSMDEYVHMFNLTLDDLEKKLVGVGDGPASFNAELARTGGSVTSVDPLYEFSADAIRMQFYRVVDNVMDQVEASPNDWTWTYHGSPEQLRKNRTHVIETFAADFTSGKINGRYVTGSLPALPFQDDQFDLALCSHFLFLYSDHFDMNFHYKSIREILRIAKEARIFPLLTLMGKPSSHLGIIIDLLIADGYTTDIQQTGYELQRGGNEMLVVRRSD